MVSAKSNVVATPEGDEVVALVRRVFAADDRNSFHTRTASEADKANDLRTGNYHRLAAKEAVDEYLATQAMLPFTKATSLTGAALQIAEAMNTAASIDDMVSNGDVEEQSVEIARKFRALDRLLWSALDIVDAAASLRVLDVHRNAGAPHLNPWTPVEDRLAILDAKQ